MNPTAAPISGHEPMHGTPTTALAPNSTGPTVANGQGGFMDLINLLLAPQEEMPPVGQPPDSTGPDPQLHPTVRSPQEIAAALIRAMSNRGRDVSTNAFSDTIGSKTSERKPREGASNPFLSSVLPVPTPVQVPAQQQNSIIGQIRAGSDPSIQLMPAVASASQSGKTAPLALALKLTPKELEMAKPGASPGDAQTNDQREAAQSPQPAHLNDPSRTATEATAAAAAAESTEAVDSVAGKARLTVETGTEAFARTEIPAAGPFRPAEVPPASPMRNPGPAPQITSRTATDALRSSAVEPLAPPPQTSTVQEIAVRVARAESAVDVHVMERAGQVHVAVRTPDPGLQTSLRQDLGTLVNALDRAGFHTEAAGPHHAVSTQQTSAQVSGNSDPKNSDSGQGQRKGGQDGGQPQQRQPERNAQDWLEAMEKAQ